MDGGRAFIEARDYLPLRREEYVAAAAEFRWPALAEFNWALDYFDPMAAGNEAAALWVVHEDGAEQKLTFAQLAQRSAQVANYLRLGAGLRDGQGRRRRRGPMRSDGHSAPSCVAGATDVPLIESTIGAFLDDAARRWAQRDALIVAHQGIRWTYTRFPGT